ATGPVPRAARNQPARSPARAMPDRAAGRSPAAADGDHRRATRPRHHGPRRGAAGGGQRSLTDDALFSAESADMTDDALFSAESADMTDDALSTAESAEMTAGPHRKRRTRDARTDDQQHE